MQNAHSKEKSNHNISTQIFHTLNRLTNKILTTNFIYLLKVKNEIPTRYEDFWSRKSGKLVEGPATEK